VAAHGVASTSPRYTFTLGAKNVTLVAHFKSMQTAIEFAESGYGPANDIDK
jgi:hypothetical protein